VSGTPITPRSPSRFPYFIEQQQNWYEVALQKARRDAAAYRIRLRAAEKAIAERDEVIRQCLKRFEEKEEDS
jgi:hypothetical protein